jgi:uncharacterized Ntn-hydrolase superfamily protein
MAIKLANTYSIVARDKRSGQLGVAVQSHYFSVGSVVPWARSGVGAVATQSLVEINYGPIGLELMASGRSAKEALDSAICGDSRKEVRQVAMVDSHGVVAAHTGERCIPYAGHLVDEENQFTVEANLMRNNRVWPAMAEAYRKAVSSGIEGGGFAENLLTALEAGEDAGGDVRGKQSAAILVVEPNTYANDWMGKVVDLRVEDSLEPLVELRRLLRLHQAYRFANLGDDFLAKGDLDRAREAYEKSSVLAPEIEELSFWHAVSLVQTGRIAEAQPIFRKVFAKNKDWIKVTKSLTECGLLTADTNVLNKLFGE